MNHEDIQRIQTPTEIEKDNEIRRLREALRWARDVDCGCCSRWEDVPLLFKDLIEWADNIKEAAEQRAAEIRARGEEQPYAAQASTVASQTHGRMQIDPATGNVSIGAIRARGKV